MTEPFEEIEPVNDPADHPGCGPLYIVECDFTRDVEEFAHFAPNDLLTLRFTNCTIRVRAATLRAWMQFQADKNEGAGR